MTQPLSKAKASFLRSFQMKKTRESEGRFLIEGWHLLEEALASGCALEALAYDESARREPAEERLLARALAASSEAFKATPAQMGQISDTRASQGVAALVARVGVSFEAMLAGLPRRGPLRLLALDGVADPGNCGAIVRCCDWFGLDGVAFGRGCAELENGKTARATMGALFHLPVAVDVDLPQALDALKSLGVAALTTELSGAISLAEFAFPERAILVVGNEARGVSPEVSARAAQRLFAPRFGKGESLNAASAAAVFLTRWRLP